ncbi:hypothetical protein [Sporocytophaga myxococcoides]|nr:hypothetical protein [Sporocytophaga myxococcoides]
MLRFYFYMLTLLTFAVCQNQANAQDVSKSTTELSVSVKTKDASSKESKDGYIRLDITGGVEPYSIFIVSTVINHQRIEGKKNLNLENLPPGHFGIIIQDNNKKILQQSVTISSEN